MTLIHNAGVVLLAVAFPLCEIFVLRWLVPCDRRWNTEYCAHTHGDIISSWE